MTNNAHQTSSNFVKSLLLLKTFSCNTTMWRLVVMYQSLGRTYCFYLQWGNDVTRFLRNIPKFSITIICVTLQTRVLFILFILAAKKISNFTLTWYCRERVSPCNIYAVLQDTQNVLKSEFYSALTLARHVSDLTGPSSGAFCTSCICRFAMW